MSRVKCDCGCIDFVISGLAKSKFIRVPTAVFVCADCCKVFTSDIMSKRIVNEIEAYESSDEGIIVLSDDSYSNLYGKDDEDDEDDDSPCDGECEDCSFPCGYYDDDDDDDDSEDGEVDLSE